jgi:hypothetical protein
LASDLAGQPRARCQRSAAVALLALRRGVMATLLCTGAAGTIAVLAGAPAISAG